MTPDPELVERVARAMWVGDGHVGRIFDEGLNAKPASSLQREVGRYLSRASTAIVACWRYANDARGADYGEHTTEAWMSVRARLYKLIDLYEQLHGNCVTPKEYEAFRGALTRELDAAVAVADAVLAYRAVSPFDSMGPATKALIAAADAYRAIRNKKDESG